MKISRFSVADTETNCQGLFIWETDKNTKITKRVAINFMSVSIRVNETYKMLMHARETLNETEKIE